MENDLLNRFRFINESVKYDFFLTLQSVLNNLCCCEKEKLSWTASFLAHYNNILEVSAESYYTFIYISNKTSYCAVVIEYWRDTVLEDFLSNELTCAG